MKIVLVHNSYYDPGGEDVAVAQERSLLTAAGHEVLEYRRDNNEMKTYSATQHLTLISRAVWASDSFRDFTSLLQQNKPDIAHVHNTFPLISPSILWACKKEGVPVVHTLHNYRLLCPGANFIRDGRPCEDCVDSNIWQSVLHGCYRGSRPQTAAVALMLSVHRAKKTWTEAVDRYIVLTAFARDRFVNAGLPAEKISIKANCVDPDPGARTREGSYALFVGRVSREKGTPTLLKAWQQMPVDVPLRIVGDGPARAQLESEAAASGLRNVTFLGRLPREAVLEQIKGSRFVIFPSQLYENLPLTIIEAFACGVPVLASKLGAMSELVEEGRTGWFFQPGDADDIARTAQRAWQQPEYSRYLGEQARKEYESKYTASANCRRLMEIYHQVIHAHSPEARMQGMHDLEGVSTL